MTNDFKVRIYPTGKVCNFWLHYSSVAVCEKPKAITRAAGSISNNVYIIRVSTRPRYDVEVIDLTKIFEVNERTSWKNGMFDCGTQVSQSGRKRKL